MAPDQSALLEVLEALKVANVVDGVRAASETIYQALIEAELTEVIGAAPHERTQSRTALRNGDRPLVGPGDDPRRLRRLAHVFRHVLVFVSSTQTF